MEVHGYSGNGVSSGLEFGVKGGSSRNQVKVIGQKAQDSLLRKSERRLQAEAGESHHHLYLLGNGQQWQRYNLNITMKFSFLFFLVP